MRVFRSLFLFTISIAVLSGLVYMVHQRGVIPQQTPLGTTPYQVSSWIHDQVEEVLIKINPTTQRLQEVSNQSGAILGDFIQVNEKESEKSIQERTLEFAQYTYCKQVVDEWEKSQ